MSDADRVAVAVLVIALVVIASSAKAAPVGVATFDPIEPVGPTGNTDPNYFNQATADLCACAPLRSFGPACEGYTWLRLPTFSLTAAGATTPIELRDRIPVACGR